MIKVTLKDGSIKEFEKGISIYEVAKSLSGRLAKEAIVGEVDGKLVDLVYKLEKDCTLNIYTFDDEQGVEVFRHSSAHVLARAVKNLFPNTKLAIGPPIENGFYYDFDSETHFSEEDFEAIEKEVKRIIAEKEPFERFELSREEALQFTADMKEDYKVELIQDLPEDEVLSFYRYGDFTDLCRGPHIHNVKQIKAFKVMSATGAYWRGDEKNKMLQRIYATSFPKAKLLEEYLHKLEEAKKRDHKKLGKEMGLFMMSEFGPGFPFFLPNGMILRNTLENFWYEEHARENYKFIKTPIMLNKDLWEISGHWNNYGDNMYTSEVDDKEFAIKPMNCPGCILVYKNDLHSYRDLPLRIGELGQVHRHELSGALNGLFRVRTFTQDDAHIFMTEDQIESEVIDLIDFVDRTYSLFGLTYDIELSTRPEEKYIGDIETWNRSEKALEAACHKAGKECKINPGDGAFYGPKLDFHIHDSLGREWQCGTIQLDMNLPERFEIEYIAADGSKKRPIMLHRVIYGSIERFIGILIEHFAGKFPLWLAPNQVKLLPIADRHLDYALEIKSQLEKEGIRVALDERHESVGYKIRQARMERTPYIVVLGDKEVEERTLSVRSRDKGELGAVQISDFISDLVDEIKTKKIIHSEE